MYQKGSFQKAIVRRKRHIADLRHRGRQEAISRASPGPSSVASAPGRCPLWRPKRASVGAGATSAAAAKRSRFALEESSGRASCRGIAELMPGNCAVWKTPPVDFSSVRCQSRCSCRPGTGRFRSREVRKRRLALSSGCRLDAGRMTQTNAQDSVLRCRDSTFASVLTLQQASFPGDAAGRPSWTMFHPTEVCGRR